MKDTRWPEAFQYRQWLFAFLWKSYFYQLLFSLAGVRVRHLPFPNLLIDSIGYHIYRYMIGCDDSLVEFGLLEFDRSGRELVLPFVFVYEINNDIS